MAGFDFVKDTLTEWGLSELITTFQDEDFDKESFLSLEEKDIENLIPKCGPRIKFKKRFKELKIGAETMNRPKVNVLPSQTSENQMVVEKTNKTSGEISMEMGESSTITMKHAQQKGKRKSDFCDTKRSLKLLCGPRARTVEEVKSTKEVREIMKDVQVKLETSSNKLNSFLREKISAAETNKKELVGVFGRTGAGKSSLINAIVGEKDLLPSGDVSACTSVMVKVEANMIDSKYTAEIEFITKEEWEDELRSLQNKPSQETCEEQSDGNDYDDDEKISAVYGKDIRESPEELMNNKYFKEVPEFVKSKNRNKILSFLTVSKLSNAIAKYIRTDLGNEKGTERYYWPLVKCVTIKLPNVDELLEHVALVDLPGTGDCNKSRDEMWKSLVGSCSAVWIVSDTNRAASEKEPWEILNSTISLIGNGGECRSISFICTKSDDDIEKTEEKVCASILKRNNKAKKQVKEKFNKQKEIKKHFDEDFFQVFTVSSREFQRNLYLSDDQTEIPKLQEFLRDLNDRQSKAVNYVSRAYGILSLIHSANGEMTGEKADVCKVLEQRLKVELLKISQSMEDSYQCFQNCLLKGVRQSKEECMKTVNDVITPKSKKGGGFHQVLKSLVRNHGVWKHKPKKGKPRKKEINLNERLALNMRDHIDEVFKENFPNKGKYGPIRGMIDQFTLGTESLIDKHKDLELLLIYLESEEVILKEKLDDSIWEKKKEIYSSLTKSIQNSMYPCYANAAIHSGNDTLKNMRKTIAEHVENSKHTMFEAAQRAMLQLIKALTANILETLKYSLKESIELSLETPDVLLPDVSIEYDRVKKCYEKLKGSHNEGTSVNIGEPPRQTAQLRCDVELDPHAQNQACVRMLHPYVLKERFSCKQMYRLECPEAGLFQCSLTGLVFKMEKKGEVQYHMVDWDCSLLAPHNLTPASPLFDIQCTQQCVLQLHLPHCEIVSISLLELLVGHIADGKLRELQSDQMTATHAILNITGCGLYGLVRNRFSSLSVRSQVLIFLQNLSPHSKMNVLLLPQNVPVSEVENYEKGTHVIQTSSNCTLSPRGRYALCCDPLADIEPKSGQFECDYGTNHTPTFKVSNPGVETMQLALLDRGNNDHKVWEGKVTLEGFEKPQINPNKCVSTDFVDKNWRKLIEGSKMPLSIADDLLMEEVITEELHTKVYCASTNRDKMAVLVIALNQAGATAKSAFYKALKIYEPQLIRDLEDS